MVGLFDKLKFNKKKVEDQQPYSEVMMDSFSLGLMKDLRRKVEEMSFRLNNLEKTIEERLPTKILIESKLTEEHQVLAEKPKDDYSELVSSELSLTEAKRIESIKFVLGQHKMLSSTQLAQLFHMSRTRANEYFKQMESMKLVEGVLIGKEKFYKIKD
jgi:hypothetical protein